jgi:predicted nucleic acid-binding Zn ribbon protein
MSDMTILHYQCRDCARRDSQLYMYGSSVAYMDCPHCGGRLAFDPNCYTCKHIGVLSIPCESCRDFSNYEQKVSR